VEKSNDEDDGEEAELDDAMVLKEKNWDRAALIP